MEPERREKDLHFAFEAGLFLKALNAVLEILFGVLLLFTSTVSTVVTFLTHQELLEDPQDFFANVLQPVVPFFSGHTQPFVAIYLLSHGIIKVFLVVHLFRRKLWAYPASIIFLLLFIVYQLYRYTQAHSVILLLLTAFDISVIALIWHEYSRVKKIVRKNVPHLST